MKVFVSAKSETVPFPHYFKECVGSGHAFLGLREDWLNQLKKVKRELGFKRVRFHGILNDDMTAGNNPGEINFEKIGKLYDRILEAGMEPLVELSFMPSCLASGEKTVFVYGGNVTVPESFEKWSDMLKDLTCFLVNRYGAGEVRKWFFEVWNEPNLDNFWAGTMEDYFKLYRYSAEAIKSVDREIRTGGPATAKNMWIEEFIDYCKKKNVPLDFISTHHYPTDTALGLEKDMEKELHSVKRGILTETAAKAKEQAAGYSLFYTEWNSSPGTRDHYHDEIYMAPFIMKTLIDNQGIADIYSFWTFSDIFEETGFPTRPFHGGFGLQTKEGIPKPSYRAFEMMSRLGKERIPVQSEDHRTCRTDAFLKDNIPQVLLYNHQTPGGDISEEKVQVHIKDFPARRGKILRIDSRSANPKKMWTEMGCPEELTEKQKRKLLESSKMREETIEPEITENCSVFRFNIPPHSALLLELN